MTREERVTRAMACSGNFFLVLTQPELRREGMSFLSFYALQRAVERAKDPGGKYSEQWLRSETGLEDYETSRACTLLVRSGLVKASKHDDDQPGEKARSDHPWLPGSQQNHGGCRSTPLEWNRSRWPNPPSEGSNLPPPKSESHPPRTIPALLLRQRPLRKEAAKELKEPCCN